MRASKRKALRRQLRAKGVLELKAEGWIAHPKTYINVRNEVMLRYTFQYTNIGGKHFLKLAEKYIKEKGHA